MLALLLAAQVAAATPEITTKVFPPAVEQKTRATPNVFREPSWCRADAQKTDHRGRRAIPRNLAEMPPARLEYAIDRRVAGCPIPVYVRDVQGEPIRSPY